MLPSSGVQEVEITRLLFREIRRVNLYVNMLNISFINFFKVPERETFSIIIPSIMYQPINIKLSYKENENKNLKYTITCKKMKTKGFDD